MNDPSVLGGGMAVNSALWWKPHPRDWDVNFPSGWKSSDMQSSVDKAWSRMPGVCCNFGNLRGHFVLTNDRLTSHLKMENYTINKASMQSQKVLMQLGISIL